MILEASSEIAYSSFPVRNDIRDFADVVEHMSRSKQEDCDQAYGRPAVAVLDNGEHVGCGDGEEGEKSKDGGDANGDPDVVDRSYEGWVRDAGELAG